MANENNEISDIVKKCKILLLDIEGTTTSISFVKDKLFPYAEENVKEFLDSNWDNEDVKGAVAALRKLAITDQENSVDGVVTIPGEDAEKEGQIEALVKSVKWQMSSDRKVGPLKQLQGLIWKRGYDKGEIKGHVYDDVSPAIDQWRSVEGQKVYIYSSGSVQAQKLLFGLSVAGDMLPLIEGHFDTTIGPKQEATSYTAIAEKIGCKPEEILFLTDIPKEGEAARASRLHVALVSREGNAPLPPDATATFPVLHSFTQLIATNKRKPDPQDELPAKVPKTDVEDDVKTAIEAESSETTTIKDTQISEKLEIVKNDSNNADSNESTKSIETPMEVETVIEEVTESNEATDTPVCDIEPVVIEEDEKTEQKQTEKMDSESTESGETSMEPKDKVNCGKDNPSVAENSPGTVITEIEEINNDKQSVDEVAEIIEDLEPVIEEPETVEDMDDLQNVGEVLEKECDEILSKVQDVTNLSNIPLKPLLNTIAEETMETDNIDSNDIVDRILDTEIELGMKPCEDIDLNTVKELSDAKVQDTAEKIDSEKVCIEETVVTPEEKPVDNTKDKKMETEEKVKETSTVEIKAEESKVETENTKMEEVSKVEEDESKVQAKENKVTPQESKAVSGSNKVDQKVDKATSEENKVKPDEEVESVENKIEPKDNKISHEQNKVAPGEIKVSSEENKVAPGGTEVISEETRFEPADNKANTGKDKEEADKTDVESKELPAEQRSTEKEISVETKGKDSVPEKVNMESDKTEAKVNGKSTNGEAEATNLNGDASKDEELSSRLSVENGKEEVNGSNSDSAYVEKGQGDNKVETEVSDIKVKTVATDEPRSDPIEQPTEA